MSSWQADLCRSIYFCYYSSRHSLTIPPIPYPKVPAASVVWGHQASSYLGGVHSSQRLFSLGLHMDVHQKKHVQKMEGRDSPLYLEHSRPHLEHCTQALPRMMVGAQKRRRTRGKSCDNRLTRILGNVSSCKV